MKIQSYTQCRLIKRLNTSSYIEHMVFIPSKYAILGNVIKIKDDDGIWIDGWMVKETFITVEDIEFPSQAIKRHRKNTEDSLPKNFA